MASFADYETRPNLPEINLPEINAINADLHDVVVTIHQEYDDRLDPCVVDQCLDQVAARFTGAAVRSFVPLLVARYVRDELQARLGQS